MNSRDSFEILFLRSVKEQNVEFTETIHRECAQRQLDAKDLLECALKCHLISITESPNLITTQHFIEFSIKIAKKNLIESHVPALLLNYIIDTMPIDKCKDFFTILNDNIQIWRDEEFYKNSKLIIIRYCNTLLERFSTVQHANFRGKILIFMAKFLPFYDRSGCNVDNQYNTDYLLVKSESSIDTMKELAVDLNIEHFKLLHEYLMDPDNCITEEHWDMFSLSTTYVLKFFMDNDIRETENSLTPPIIRKTQLTNSALRIYVYNCRYRRELLVQILMIYQYLNSKVLKKEQLETIASNSETIYKILIAMPPNGQKFVTTIKNMLESEKRWSAWKSAGCPGSKHPKPASTTLKLTPRPAKRQLGDIWKEKVTGNKSSLESVSPDTTTLDDSMLTKRDFLPTLTSYLREAAEELTPESTVAEHNKKICDGSFGWKALRLIAKRSNRFYDYSKDPMPNKSEYLKNMILKVLDAERASAEMADDQLYDEACASTIQVPITNAEFEALFGTLGDDWKVLARKLGFTESEIESVTVSNPTPSSRASCILRSWFLGPTDPSIEYFCTVMDSIGHSEISKIIQLNYLPIHTHEEIEKNRKAIEEKLKLIDLQDTIRSPDSVIDDDDPSSS